MTRFGATIVGVDGLCLSAGEKAFFRDTNPYGFILFARNVDHPDQLRALCAELRDCVGRDAPITIDQEGGRVQRMRSPHWQEWLPPLDFIDRAGASAAEAMYLRYRLIAAELRQVGIDSNCAPMLDLMTPQTHEFLRNRCYGNDPARVAELGRAAANGLLDGGVLPIMKHMPGHGRTTLDTHFDLPHVEASADVLRKHDFAPFRALNDMPMGMTGHLVFNAYDDQPATISSRMIRVIREEIGFDNLLMTDDMGMKALKDPPEVIALKALDAGCDLLLHCNATLDERRRVSEVAGQMSEAAQTRALRALEARKTPTDIDIPALQRQVSALLNA